ncbi:MAG TPA: D-2-hydroxyacid dehydrogenase [Longimicrobium sp.]|jgi:phosphoglycerate dehydrogenase-like enzyme|uniref:D-2-hydroxyacid dehydrogenase n=1 Tax=Longimicrobium sp. TaxID=2029185 RepID=UPI002ED96D0D
MNAPRRLVIHLRDSRPAWSIPEWAVDRIRAALPDGWEAVEVDAPADGRGDGGGALPDDVLQAVRGAEVYLGFGVPGEIVRAAPTLRWAHTASAGVGGALRDLADSGIVLTNAAGIYAEPMADTVLAMMLHFARGLDFAVRAQAERRWDKEPFDDVESPVRELSEGTVGIVGLGGIGRAVARRAAALGMRVVASRRAGGEGPDGVEVLHGDDALRRLLPRADYLVVTVPHTAETEGLIGARELALLPEGAVVINVARGAVIHEEALVDALRAGRLRGAGLDVFAREPLPHASPLWTLPNVLVTPHVSGASHRFWRRQTDLIVENIRRYASGGPLRNTVDKKAGY